LTPTDDAPEQEPAETPEPEATEEAEAPAEQPEAAAEQPAAEEAPADEPGAEEAPAEEAPAEETAEPAAEEAPAAEAPAAEEASAEETPAAPAAEGKKDVVPGANLEPIAITEERELTAEERAALEAEEEERASREAAANADEDELPRRTAVAVPADATIQATGKRKSSVARVVLRAGDGNIEVNGRAIDDYFPRPHHQSIARQPLVTAGYEGNVDVKVRVHGGGVSGQAGAVRHGLARALTQLDPELRGDLKKRGMLTRDARAKERRKAGLKKARKKPQFSKR
jgi:small subunit ribosomal protein S9